MKSKNLKQLRALYPIITTPEMVPPGSRHPAFRYGDMGLEIIRLYANGKWGGNWILFYTGTDKIAEG